MIVINKYVCLKILFALTIISALTTQRSKAQAEQPQLKPVPSSIINLKNSLGSYEINNGITRWVDESCSGQTSTCSNPLYAYQGNSSKKPQINYEHGGIANSAMFSEFQDANEPGDYLELINSKDSFNDQSFTVFYVGRSKKVSGSPAFLVGNMQNIGKNPYTYAGWRFSLKDDGALAFQYGSPEWNSIDLNTFAHDEYFYFGFTVDENGVYRYFDNKTEQIVSGELNKYNPSRNKIVTAHDEVAQISQVQNILLNGSRSLTNNLSHFYTSVKGSSEVVQLMLFNDTLNVSELNDIKFNAEKINYKPLVNYTFKLESTEVTQFGNSTQSLDVLAMAKDSTIKLDFNKPIDEATSAFPVVYVNKNPTPAAGTWSVNHNSLTFTKTGNWPYSALVKVKLNPNLKSQADESLGVDSVDLGNSAASEVNFLVENEQNKAIETIDIETVATRVHPQSAEPDGHNIPGILTLPADRTTKVPLYLWIHGGGWQGGSPEASVVSKNPHADYLAKTLGIATFDVAYRTIGSDGSFNQALEDIESAYDWAVANQAQYNFDMDKIILGGGSAGSPLAALAALKLPNVKAFIGLNGIYDFVHTEAKGFGSAAKNKDSNGELESLEFSYKQNEPKANCTHFNTFLEPTLAPYLSLSSQAQDNLTISQEEYELTATLYANEVEGLSCISPFYQLSAASNNLPKTILLHGDADTTIDIRQSQLFRDKLNCPTGTLTRDNDELELFCNIQSKEVAKLVTYEGKPHAFFNAGKEDYEDVLWEITQFLKFLNYPTGQFELVNTSLSGSLRSSSEIDPTSANHFEVELLTSSTDSTKWTLVESNQLGWYFIQNEMGYRLQLTNIPDQLGNTPGQAVRMVSHGDGSWQQWKLVESDTSGKIHLENKQFGLFLRANDSNMVHAASKEKNGPWTQWSLISQ